MQRIFFLSILFFPLFSLCQNLTVKTINHLNLNPVADVKILVLDNNGNIVTINSTDINGRISLDIPYGTYKIKASHVAYKKWTRSITFSTSNPVIIVNLMQKIENLDEVLIQASGYIRKHGDTTTISLPKIVNGKERNVIDVLKKIKGVKVLDDGTVIYNKKEVTDVLINGTKIFDNDYKSVLDKIRPHEMVKIQFIENYKDDTNSDLIAKDAMAMNLEFKDKLFFSGTLEGGLGISSGRVIGINLLQNAKWITSFVNLRHQNTGISESYKMMTNNELLNTDITSHYAPYTSLSSLNATGLNGIDATDFNDTYSSRINTTIKLSKKTQLLIKSNNIREELTRFKTVTSQFTVDDEPIIRNEFTNQSVNHINSENNIGILHKNQKSIFKTDLYFKKLSHDYQQDIDLNGDLNEQLIDESRQHFNLNIKYERLLSNNIPLVLNAGYHYKPLNQKLNNHGFTNINQELKTRENIYYANASLLHKQQDSSIAGIYLKSKLSGIEQNLNSIDNANTFFNEEKLMTNEIKFDWVKNSKTKEWNISPGANLYVFDLDSDYSYLKFTPLLKASLKIKNEKTTHSFLAESTTDWVLNNPFTPFNVLDSFNSSYGINSTNDINRSSQFSYSLSTIKNLDNISISSNLRHNSKSLLSDFSIDVNNSINNIEITDRDTYSLGVIAKYNTLLWKLFFFEVSLNPSLVNSFIKDNNDIINKINNRVYSAEMKFNRRFTEELFIGTTTQLNYREFKSDLGTNDVLNYSTKVYLTWEFGNFELKGDYDHIKLGNDVKAVNFASFNLNYTPKKSNFKGYLQLFNVLNTESIVTSSSSNTGEFLSSFNLPQRRFIASLAYTF
ncbi:hypothetical protein [uncultured Winogradskyella sp.]|uniref:hypothetical protein n=1 Tax=uncultured Winogradskyella sp. TaxID=395353 RepID=UPI00263485D1|nr:hypothetical protein [uncultured Winogradskyella sp.]